MTPTAKVVSLLKANTDKLEGIEKEHVHAFMIPPQDDTKKDAIIVVSEAGGGRHGYGNDNPIYERGRLQVEFYYPKNYTKDMQKTEQDVRSFLFEQNYICYSTAGHVMTPDTQNITNTLKFNYITEDF